MATKIYYDGNTFIAPDLDLTKAANDIGQMLTAPGARALWTVDTDQGRGVFSLTHNIPIALAEVQPSAYESAGLTVV